MTNFILLDSCELLRSKTHLSNVTIVWLLKKLFSKNSTPLIKVCKHYSSFDWNYKGLFIQMSHTRLLEQCEHWIHWNIGLKEHWTACLLKTKKRGSIAVMEHLMILKTAEHYQSAFGLFSSSCHFSCSHFWAMSRTSASWCVTLVSSFLEISATSRSLPTTYAAVAAVMSS